MRAESCVGGDGMEERSREKRNSPLDCRKNLGEREEDDDARKRDRRRGGKGEGTRER